MKKTIDTTALNLETYNNPATVADATADAEGYLPYVFDHPFFQEFNKTLPGKRILDLGAGPGILAQYYASQGKEVTCLDFSDNMIEAAMKNCPDCQKFIVKNVLDLDPSDGEYDGIVAFHLVQFLDKKQLIKFFKQVASCLAKDGKFLVVFTNTCHPKSGVNTNSTGLQEYWNRWQLDDIVPLFSKSGLELVKFEQPTFESGEQPFMFITQKSIR